MLRCSSWQTPPRIYGTSRRLQRHPAANICNSPLIPLNPQIPLSKYMRHRPRIFKPARKTILGCSSPCESIKPPRYPAGCVWHDRFPLFCSFSSLLLGVVVLDLPGREGPRQHSASYPEYPCGSFKQDRFILDNMVLGVLGARGLQMLREVRCSVGRSPYEYLP